MSKLITVKETNKKLSKGIIPTSLDHGFIPSAEKVNECLQAQRNSVAEDQVDRLIEEIKSTSLPVEKKDRGRSLYVVDDYDDETSGDEQNREVYYQQEDIPTARSMPSNNGFGKLLRNSTKKISKVKKAIQNKLQR